MQSGIKCTCIIGTHTVQNIWLYNTYKVYLFSVFCVVRKNGADVNTLIVLWVKNRCVIL